MKIRVLLAALAISAFMCVPAQAQDELETRHEIAVSYGAVPNSVWIDIFSDVVPAIFGEAHENTHYIGPIGLEYYYHTSPLIGVGVVGVFATNNEDAFRDKKMTAHINKSYTTLMPSVKFNWLRKKHFGMYSALSAGAMFASVKCNDNAKAADPNAKDETVTVFMFQVTALGVEFGGQQFRGFVEAGAGEKGLLCAGLRYKF